jgi:hypothetical protein
MTATPAVSSKLWPFRIAPSVPCSDASALHFAAAQPVRPPYCHFENLQIRTLLWAALVVLVHAADVSPDARPGAFRSSVLNISLSTTLARRQACPSRLREAKNVKLVSRYRRGATIVRNRRLYP